MDMKKWGVVLIIGGAIAAVIGILVEQSALTSVADSLDRVFSKYSYSSGLDRLQEAFGSFRLGSAIKALGFISFACGFIMWVAGACSDRFVAAVLTGRDTANAPTDQTAISGAERQEKQTRGEFYNDKIGAITLGVGIVFFLFEIIGTSAMFFVALNLS
jgi:hypothetical protein